MCDKGRGETYNNHPSLVTRHSSPVTELLKKMLDGNAKTIIHLPKKIKKVTGKNLKEKEAKTVTFEYNLFDSTLGKVNSDFSIKMKKSRSSPDMYASINPSDKSIYVLQSNTLYKYRIYKRQNH